MNNKTQVPAIEGWYTMDTGRPRLIGTCCKDCGTYYFPKQSMYCKNPHCDSTEFNEVALSNRGTIWSYTNACYQPPEPYVSPDPFKPFILAAVKLEKEQMIVLGQVTRGINVGDLTIGGDMELVLDILYEDQEDSKMIWKWKPVTNA